MLTPSKLDPNYKAEMERKKREPHTFGMGIPLPDEKRNLTGSGLTADRDKAVAAPALTDEELAAIAAAEEASAKLLAFLDQSIHDITPELESMDDDQLASLHVAETAGKVRKGLLEAIEEELSSR